MKCNLKRFLVRDEISCLSLAKQLNLNRTCLNMLKNNRLKRIDCVYFEKLCKYFNCSIDEMFTLENKNFKK